MFYQLNRHNCIIANVLVICCVNMSLSGAFKSFYHTWQKTLISGWKPCLVPTRALRWKSLKSGVPKTKMQNVLKSGSKHCFVKGRTLCWKSLKVAHAVRKWQEVLISSSKFLFCTNSCTSLKIARKWCAQCKSDKTCWSRDENFCFVQTRTLS